MSQPGEMLSSPPGDSGRPRLLFGLVSMLLLGGLTAFLYFTDLNGSALGADEAIYARVVDTMLQTGDWLHPVFLPGRSPFDKPPLYLWLTASTHALLDGELAYRFWSALFGLLAVLLTYVLGAQLFGLEVGLLAGLILATNRCFAFWWGARMGCMDTALTFFTLAAALVVYRGGAWKRPWLAWSLVGACMAALTLIKPFAGFPFLTILAGYHLLAHRQMPLPRRLLGPAIALGVSVALSLPWHALQYRQYGFLFIQEYILVNVLRRGTHGVDPGHLHGPLYYLQTIALSSPWFVLFLPALLLSALLIRRGIWRRELIFVAGASAVIVGLLSLPASKLTHYAYPAYPFIAVTIAAGVWFFVEALASRCRGPSAGRIGWGCLIALALLLCARGVRLARVVVPSTRSDYAPMVVYQRIRPQMERNACDLIFYRFQKPATDPDFDADYNYTDVCYLSKMPLARWVDEPAQLRRLLAKGRPTLVVVRSGQELPALLPRPLAAERLPLAAEKRFELYAVQPGARALSRVLSPGETAGRH
jgi:4-amino-4-deoxy-L-arabinose transferase-like glycosyltransferase